MKKHFNLGCAEPPIHPQHITLMERIAPLSEWELVDLYVRHPDITNLDATTLDGVPDGSLHTIYASHLLEHISHRRLLDVLDVWHDKLASGGTLILNVPDILWAFRQIQRWNAGQLIDGVYDTFEGDRGFQSIIYGTHAHEGEYHKAAFTKRSLNELLINAGFYEIVIVEEFEAHDMGCLIATATKVRTYEP